MMQMRRYHIGLWLIIGSLTGCTKDVAQFSPASLADSAWVQQVPASSAVARLRDTLQYSLSADTLLLAQTDTLSLGKFSCILPGSGWTTGQGTAYSGTAVVRARLFDKPGEWIRLFAGTLPGGVPVGTDALVYLDVTTGGAALTPTDTVRFDGNGDDSLWTGGYGQNTLQWNVPGSAPGTLRTGWFLFGTTVPGTGAALTITLPQAFSNANTAVFCWMPGKRVLACLSGAYSTRSFTVSGLPADDQAIVLSITLSGSAYYLGLQPVPLSDGEASVALVPGLRSLAYITNYLEQL
jgi:hypothetical protein